MPPIARILTLCICLLGSCFVQGQVYSPEINNLTINTNTNLICAGEEIDISFQVRNGYTRNWFLIFYYTDFIPFTTSTNYKIFLNSQDGPQEIKSFSSQTAPGARSTNFFEITTSLTIPEGFSGSNYTLEVQSTNPNARSVPSNTFTINPSTFYQESEAGNDSWIGHVYDGTNQNITFDQNFNNYIRGYTENLSFDQSFGGDTNNFQIGTGICAPFIYTETFSVRYRMNSSLSGLYSLNTGSDDGSRLSVDGKLIYNDWNDHAYRNQNILLSLSGNSNLVLDYYENSGGNRISIGEPQLIIKNILSNNLNQTLNFQTSGQTITGDEFNGLPSGISRFGNGYQWVYSTTENGETTAIPGATNASFTPNRNLEPFNTEGTYYIYRIATLTSSNNRLANAYRASKRSNVAIITVEKPIDIVEQPENFTACTGNPINFNVIARGQNLSYQWQRNNGGNTGFYNIDNGEIFSGTQTSGLSINVVETSLNNIKFRVKISDRHGNSVTSNPALLNLYQSPQGIYTQPTNQIVCEGNDISFQTYTSNDQRQWQVSEDSGISWSNISNNEFYQNVNSQKLDIINAPAHFNNNLYRIAVSNQNCKVYSQPANLQVNLNPITQQPQDVTAGFGENAIIEAGVSGNNLTFQWQTYSSNWYDINDNANYSGTKTKRLELLTVGYFPVDGSRYRLLVTNANGCVSISDTAFLNVGENQCPEMPTVSLNAPLIICSGQANINGTFTGTAPWNIEASINGQTFNLSINERNFDYPINIQQNTTIEILGITDANGCTNNNPNESVTINVINSIKNNTISGAQESCGVFDAERLIGEDLGEGYNYEWEISTTGGTTSFTQAPGNNTESDYNPGTVSETTWYRRKVNVQNCNEDISNSIEITINTNIANNKISFFNGNTNTLQTTANENGEVNIESPEETIFTYVDFASYGTPVNNAGNFDINENCHANTSQAVTEAYLLGENSATISATNGVFTDPCVGTFKRLYISATYSEAFCKGIDPGIVSGTEIEGNNISYTWQLSTEGPASGFADAPGNNNQQNYNPGILNTDIWLKRIVNSGSCTNESPVLYIPVQEENTWTGAENTNWNNSANWSCNALPTLETDVLIPENLPSNNYPKINSGVNAYTKNLSIENNASVMVEENWLRIAGDLTNNGILNTVTGNISFQGASAQTIPSTAFQYNRIQNLRIDNTSGVNSQATIEITGTLNVVEGNFDTGNGLTLISDENQTALISGAGNGEVIGIVKMQRYLDKAFGYKYFSSPFQNSTVGDFAPYMDFEDPVTGFPHFYSYNENRNININDIVRDATGWEVYTTTTNSLNNAEGYALNFGTSTASQTIELSGEVNNGTIPTRQLENNHREYTRGFHLVGNPYPSPIDWDASQGWTKTNIDDGIYFFTASDTSQYTGTYSAYVNQVSTTDGKSSNIIPSMQGFFIKVMDSDTQDVMTGSFGMDNRVRINDFEQEFLRTQEDLKPLIRLEAGFKTSIQQDPMVIYFSSYATPNFEKEMDAHKLMNTDPAVPSFYNITENKKELAINAIPFPESRSYKKIPLGIKADENGEMKINLVSVENFNSNFNIYLIDHEKGKGQNLRNNPEYSFNLQAGTHNSRFELMFSEERVTSPAIAFNEPFDVEVENGDVVVKMNLEENQEGILRASSMTGQILQIKEAGGKDEVIFEGITSEGVYIINLQVGKAYYGKKVLIKK
ncbi:SUEL-type lectin domain-containing protein [Salegentibacter sp. T436]|uniref:SUEL-type lectin domain-containing protein n=1 Tax=Salegentibacter sp. T436 TaxID=1729720 RepID=UPI000AD15C30|nr:SUEL-type lectin domain-containing protein [Salegentibacter sp. T436]